MNHTMKKLSLVLLTACMAVVFAACGGNGDKKAETSPPEQKQEQVNNQKQEETKHEDQVIVDKDHEDAADTATFSSKVAGFSLKYPEVWNNLVKTIDEPANDTPSIDRIVSFMYAPKGEIDPNSASLFTVYKVSKKEYDKMKKEEGPALGEVIAENDKEVWLGALPQSNPYDLESKEGKQFQDILMNFEFLKKNFAILT
ncbi:hypothetical protein [Paenibacillus guangzhouensis]|uniref:hypothetical protein n=1 Tax=Paenibacillus guangzhouensis TaxID=1473112 RepID=UPI0012672449|nr:hypothetical protein [Paenibacillus guangzhouensis]